MTFYTQNLAGCFDTDIGDEGLSEKSFTASLLKAQDGVTWIRSAYENRQWPLLLLPEERSDLESLTSIADLIKQQSQTVLVLGAGGSSLGGQTLQGLAALDEAYSPQVIFMENLDGHSFTQRLKSLELDQTTIIAISKSGRTAETAMQVFALIAAYRAAGLQDQITQRFLFITRPDAARASSPG